MQSISISFTNLLNEVSFSSETWLNQDILSNELLRKK